MLRLTITPLPPRSHGILVRTARFDDLDTLAAFEAQYFPRPFSFGVLWNLLRLPPPSRVIVAEAADAIVGYAAYHIASGIGRLLSIAVTASHRRRGVGTLLLEQFCADARPHAHTLELEVAVQNLAAQQFYEQHGFHRGHRIPSYYGPSEDAWLMQRKVARAGP